MFVFYIQRVKLKSLAIKLILLTRSWNYTVNSWRALNCMRDMWSVSTFKCVHSFPYNIGQTNFRTVKVFGSFSRNVEEYIYWENMLRGNIFMLRKARSRGIRGRGMQSEIHGEDKENGRGIEICSRKTECRKNPKSKNPL